MADNYTYKDGAGLVMTHASKELSAGVHASKHIEIDANGAPINYYGSTVLSAAVSVTTSATALPTSALSNRRVLWIYNNGAVAIYLGASGVTTSAGFPLLPGQSVSLEIGALPIYGRVASGTAEARIMEIA